MWIADELAVDEVVIMPGNSDLYVYKDEAIIFIIKEELEKFSINVKVVNEGHIIDIEEKKVMLCNTIGETPWRLVGGLVPEILGLSSLYAREYSVDAIVCGHYHVFAMSPELILLPSFQWSDNPMYWARGGLMMTDEGLIIPIVYKQMTDYSNPDAIDELENWLHSIKQRVLISGRNEKVRFCIDCEGYRRSR